MSSSGDIERRKQEIKQGLERLRGSIRTRVAPREQAPLLDAVDRIQDTVLGPAADAVTVTGNIQRGKDSTRRILRTRPVDMVQILNELDGLEEDVTKLLQELTREGPVQ